MEPRTLSGSGICDAVGASPIMGQSVSMDDCADGHIDDSCDCTSGFEMEMSGEKVCGNIDDCGNCVDKVNGYTCDCDEDHELMLWVNGSVCVAMNVGERT